MISSGLYWLTSNLSFNILLSPSSWMRGELILSNQVLRGAPSASFELLEMEFDELVEVLKKFDSRFINSDLNLVISSSILRISASKRSRMLENSLSMTLKSPNLMGMLRLWPLSDMVRKTLENYRQKNGNTKDTSDGKFGE